MILDTCALLWNSFEEDNISKNTLKKIQSSNELFISSISIYEIGLILQKKKYEMPISLEKFVEILKASKEYKIIPVDEDIYLEAISLKWDHKDPADRVIVATAKKYGVPIITRDNWIKKFYKNVYI